VDVIVVGAGIIGVSVADRLAALGASVKVLEMRSPGRGASQASAGMLAPHTEAHGDPELLQLGTRSLNLFDDLVRSLEAETGRPVEYRRTGTLEVAFDAEGRQRLLAAKRSMEARDVDCEFLEPGQIPRRDTAISPDATAALFTAPHGFVGVDSLIRALVHRARLAGAVFESPVEGVGVEAGPASVQVRAGDRVDRADYVVIAAGSWSGRVRVRHVPALPMRPVRGQLLHLRWAGPGALSGIVWGPRCYVVPWSDGTLLVGATVEEAGFNEEATAAGIRDLAEAVIQLLPAAATARFDAVRVGLRPALPDGLPAIGPLRQAPRVVVATGHYRNGVLLAPVTAEMVATYILDGARDPAFAAVSPDRFVS
jgi:glycine oxidase